MNKRNSRWVTIESVVTDPEPRTKVTVLVGKTMPHVQVRVSKGPSHQTVTMGVGAWRHLVDEVEERLTEQVGPRP